METGFISDISVVASGTTVASAIDSAIYSSDDLHPVKTTPVIASSAITGIAKNLVFIFSS
jgi:hypothetical protein